jgi:uncharacterized protein (DUF4415 family)
MSLQFFTEEYIERCLKMTPTQRAQFVEDYRKMFYEAKIKSPSRLISMKVPQDLLDLFKKKSELENTPYQTKIKDLMKAWIKGSAK